MNRGFALGLLFLTVGALVLRCPELDQRPLHNDEAVNALKLQALWEKGTYRYDPDEFHGPTLHYAALPFLWLRAQGQADPLDPTSLRRVTVAFGAGLVLLLGLVAKGLGARATLWAAAFTAISPAMVFYSRYFIHEMLLVFFTLLTFGATWRYVQSPGRGWAALAGAGLGLMYATKETFVLELGAAALAAGFVFITDRGRPTAGSSAEAALELAELRPAGPWLKDALLALGIAVVVSELLFSSFLQNPRGPMDAVLTYLPWLQRAGGDSPHIHPWAFYLERLFWFHAPRGPFWSEGALLVLGLVGAGAAFRRGSLAGASRLLVQFLAVYTLVLAGGYSVIAYKTPWCLLGFHHGLILLAGVGAAVVCGTARGSWQRAAAWVAVLAASLHLGWQAWRASFRYASSRSNPYVYAQTVPSLLDLVRRVEAISAGHPAGRRMLVQVASPADDYWPLPYYLRRLEQVGWYRRVPEAPYAPVMIVASALSAALDEKTDKRWLLTGVYELRPQVFVELYVEFEMWRRWVEQGGPAAEAAASH